MKKKIFSLTLCFVMCLTVLTGCNLFGTDLATYYNEVVATINYNYELNGLTITESEDITKRDLINAYNSYGYYYVSYYGYTTEDALELTLDTIINRKLMIKDVEVTYAREGKDLFNDRETSYLWQSTFDAFLENLTDYYNDIMGIEDSEDDSSSSSTSGVYQPYEQNATYYTYTDANGVLQYGVKKITAVSTVSGSYQILENSDGVFNYEYQNENGEYVFKELIYNILKESYTTPNVQWRSAMSQYLQEVRDNYSYIDFEDDDEVFYFELDRIYQILRDNYVVEKYEELYNRAAEEGSTLTNVRVQNIIDYYTNEVLTDYYTYRLSPSTFETDVLSSSTLVNYVYKATDATNYFYVGVIQLSFKDGQTTPSDVDGLVGDKYVLDADEYEAYINSLYNQIYTYIKDETTGESTGVKIFAQDLLDELEALVSQYQNRYLDYDTIMADDSEVQRLLLNELGYDSTTISTLTASDIRQLIYNYVEEENKEISYECADAFLKYYYYYNDDTTYQNSNKTSVFGISSDGEVVYNDTFSSAQNDAFDEALIKLYNNGKAQVGDLSDLIRTDDGIYILFYAGAVENLFGDNITSNFSLTFADIKVLASTRVNIFYNMTYFDYIYDAIYEENNFDNFETENLNYLKKTLTSGTNGIVKYPDGYSDLY